MQQKDREHARDGRNFAIDCTLVHLAIQQKPLKIQLMASRLEFEPLQLTAKNRRRSGTLLRYVNSNVGSGPTEQCVEFATSLMDNFSLQCSMGNIGGEYVRDVYHEKSTTGLHCG